MKEKFFKNVFANVVLTLTVISVFLLGFSEQIKTSFISSNELKPHYNGDTTKNNVSLMVNVYGGSEYLEGMLDILKKHGVHATFFLGGVWVVKNEALVKRIFDEGHELGNHGYLHLDHKKLNRERNEQEILATERIIEGITGFKTRLFAPPSGSFNQLTLEVAKDLGYQSIMWSADTIDWRDQDQTLIYNRVMKKLGNGALILTHPTLATKSVLDKMLTAIKEKGYSIVKVTDNIVI